MALTTLDPILKSPLLALYTQRLQTMLDEEEREREAYYDWLTEDTKAEFINGEVVVQSPAKDRHTVASMNLSFLLGSFVEHHDLGAVRSETCLITLTRNDYLPDVCFFGREKSAEISPNQMKYPAPDFIAEILSPSTADVDRTTKFEDYEAHGVAEYWLVDPDKQVVEQYVLHDGVYELLFKVGSGDLTSKTITNLTIPIAAIFDRKIANQTLVQLLTSQA